jgi:oligopeptide transport system permease protein
LAKKNRPQKRFEPPTSKPRTPAGDAWRAFRANKIAMAGMVFVILVTLAALIAPLITPYDFATQNTRYSRSKPMTPYIVTTDKLPKCHWAGTPLEWGCTLYVAGSDALGRDLLSRVIYGTRVSLAVALVGSSVSFFIGIIYGTISGFIGGRLDMILMRVVDFLYAVPFTVIVILMQVYFKALTRQGATGAMGVLIGWNQAMGGMLFLFIALGALSWLGMARLARGQVLSHKNKEFIEAARAIGAGNARIIFRHMLPNIVGPLLVSLSMGIPGWIFFEVFLSFIGLGVDPPTPSWGAMISEGAAGIRSASYMVIVPGTLLTLLTLAFNFMGDGLRDAFDPSSHGR